MHGQCGVCLCQREGETDRREDRETAWEYILGLPFNIKMHLLALRFISFKLVDPLERRLLVFHLRAQDYIVSKTVYVYNVSFNSKLAVSDYNVILKSL